MSNANEPAFPQTITHDTHGDRLPAGLTKREYFAAQIFQGFAACPDIDGAPKYFKTSEESDAYADKLMHQHAARAVEWADALIAALEKTK
jgi:hypothetical protein